MITEGRTGRVGPGLLCWALLALTTVLVSFPAVRGRRWMPVCILQKLECALFLFPPASGDFSLVGGKWNASNKEFRLIEVPMLEALLCFGFARGRARGEMIWHRVSSWGWTLMEGAGCLWCWCREVSGSTRCTQEAGMGMIVLGEEDHGLCWVKHALGNAGWRRGI